MTTTIPVIVPAPFATHQKKQNRRWIAGQAAQILVVSAMLVGAYALANKLTETEED